MDDPAVILSAAKDLAPNDELTSIADESFDRQDDESSAIVEDAVIPQPSTGPHSRPRSRDRKWLLSLGAALALHAGLIAAGFVVYKVREQYEPPQLILPVGWATEFDGAGERGGAAAPLLRPQPPLALDAPPATAEPSVKSLLGPPPSEFQPPEPAAPAVALDPNEGTGDVAIAGRSSDASPPLFPTRTPPGLSDGVDDARTTSSAPAPDADFASGKSDAGSGDSTAGSPQGVPDGMPLPSFRNRRPAYPELAQRRGWTGTVYLELDLDPTGRVTAVRLIKSSGHDLLDRAAIDEAKSWTYTPATLNGRPIAVTVPIPVNFALR
jgi:protein TonB